MRNHRVPLLGDSWQLPSRRTPDPETSTDPQLQLVMAGLRQLSADAPAPSAQFRGELRAQLVAIAPRIVAEGDPKSVATAERTRVSAKAVAPRTIAAGGRGGGGSPRAAGSGGARSDGGGALALPIGRIFAVAAAMVVAMLVLLGGAVYFSRDALPGDSLYGVKLAAERAELAVDSDADRPADLLRFASYRVDEAQQLVASRATAAGNGPVAAGLSPQTESLISTALSSFDSDVREASQMLGKQAVSDASGKALGTLTTWAPAQVGKLRALSTSVSGSTVSSQVSRSISVVTTASNRAKSLVATVDCHCLGGSPSDSYGPRPPRVVPGQPSSGHRSTGSTHTTGQPQTGTTPTGGNGNRSTTGGSNLPGLPTPSTSATVPPPLHGVTTPTVPAPPTGLHSPPSTSKCGVHVNLPIVKVSLGDASGC